MNLNPANLPVVLLYNLDRSWSAADAEEIQNLAKELETGLMSVGHPTQTACLEEDNLDAVMSDFNPDEAIVFNWCEEIPGIPRSSPLVAEGLERLGFTFTGADSQALQFSHDKPAVKETLDRKEIPTPAWHIYEAGQTLSWDLFPAIIKPAFEHSSMGITRDAVVHSREELATQVIKVFNAHEQPVLIEDFIDGREFHATIIGNGRLQVLPIAEMDFSGIAEDQGRVCTYDSKFTPASQDYQMIQLHLPADLRAEEKKKLEKVAIDAYRATDCRDYARLDIRQRDGNFYILDINPNADISPDTSPILSAALAGYSYGEFGSRLVQLAAHRHPVFSGGKAKVEFQKQPALVLQG